MRVLTCASRYDLPLTKGNELDERYPSMVQFQNGTASVPTATDLVWLDRAMATIMLLCNKHPNYLTESIPGVIGGTYAPLELEIDSSYSKSSKEKITLKNALVLTMKDFDQFKAQQE